MILTPSASFTRPANTTQYTANDLVADSATAGSVTPMVFNLGALKGSAVLHRARLHKTTTTSTAASFKLYLFTESPTVTNGDNGAFAVSSAASLVGTIAVDLSSGATTGTNSMIGFSSTTEILVNATSTSFALYGLLLAVGAYAPGSGEVFTLTLEASGENS